jgi:hypothetical protein
MMVRRLLLLLLAPALSACYTVASVETAVPAGQEVFEPRLVGTWELKSDSSVSGRMVITRETANEYLIRDLEVQGPSAAYKGRLGPLGPGRWILELSPVGDTSKYVHPLSRKDSTRLAAPDLPLMLPLHMPLVIERADSGLTFAALRGDSLRAALQSGRVRTPFAIVQSGDISATVLLTEDDPQKLNVALRGFAALPGVLLPLPKVGRSLSLPSTH